MSSLAPKQYGITFTIGDLPSSGQISVVLGQTVDQARMLRLQQSTANVQITLPTPVDTAITYGIDVVNEGTVQTEVEGVTLQAGQGARFAWNGTAWFQVGGPSSSGVWAPIGRYNPQNDTFSSQISTAYVTLPAASAANSGQVFELSDDANSTNWLSPNAPSGLVSEGDWIYSNGTSWIVWRNQNRRIGHGDTIYSPTQPTERNTTHPLEIGDLWLNSASQEMHQYNAAGLWERINDPISIINGTASPITTLRSESYVAADNVGLIPFVLNPSAVAGEHVRIYWNHTITGTGSFSVNGKTYDKNSGLDYVDLVYSGSAGFWYSYETYRQTGNTFNLKGLLFADQNRIDDIVSGSTIAGGLPVASSSNIGDAYIAGWSVESASWATPNMPATDIAEGDLIISDGISWNHRRMTDQIIGAGDIQVSAIAPTKRSHEGTSGTLYIGDLWISSAAEKNRLSYKDGTLAWAHVGADDMSKAIIESSTFTAQSTLNQTWMLQMGSSDVIEIVSGAYDGQIFRFVRDTSWALGSPTITPIGCTISYAQDADKLNKNKIGEIVAIYNQATNDWRIHHLATVGGGVEVASTAPTPADFDAGDMWWDDVNLELYVLHDDSITKAWVSTSGTGGPLTSVVQGALNAVVDCSLGNVYDFTVIGAMTLSFTNPPGVGNAYIATCRVVVNAGGTLSYPATVKWPSGVAPILTANPFKNHILTFMTIDGGVTWFGNALTDY